MKRIEVDTLLPSKSRWEFSIIPNINFGYDSSYSSNGSYYITFAWLLWYMIVIIKIKNKYNL